MYLKQSQIAQALKTASKKCELFDIKFAEPKFSEYLNTLKEIKNKSAYNEGDPISKEDKTTICKQVSSVLNAMYEKLLLNNTAWNKISNSADYMMAAGDYLFALTMQELGSPDMDPLFNPEVEFTMKKCAEGIHDAHTGFAISTASTLEKQKGVNAEDLCRDPFNVNTRIDAVKGPHSKPSDIGQLTADYQALKTRQDNHGAVWRFFHRKENNARNELLNKMETALKNALGEKTNLTLIDPASQAQKIANQQFDDYFRSCAAARKNPLTFEKVYNLDKMNKEFIENTNRQQLNPEEQKNLINDTTAKISSSVQSPIKEAPKADIAAKTAN